MTSEGTDDLEGKTGSTSNEPPFVAGATVFADAPSKEKWTRGNCGMPSAEAEQFAG